MRRIDLALAFSQSAAPPLCAPLAARTGLSPQTVSHVLASAAGLLTAALAARAAQGREAATQVFAALMAGHSNPHIGSTWPREASTTAGLRDLEQTGDTILALATGRRAASLADHLASRCAIPPQAAHLLTCVAAAILAGLIKHHLLLAQASVLHLPGLLAAQMPAVEAAMDDSVAATLGYLSAASFCATVPPRLAAVAADVPAARLPAATPYGLHDPMAPPAPAGEGRPAPRTHAAYAGPVHYAGLPAAGSRFPLPGTAAPAAATAGATAATSTVAGAAAPDRPRLPARRTPWLLAGLGLAALAAWVTLSPQPPAEAPAHTASAGPVQAPPATVPVSAPVPASVTVPAASAPVAPASTAAVPPAPDSGWLDARTGAAGLPAVQARLAGDTQRASLASALDARFGAGRVQADITTGAPAEPPWLGHLDALLPLLAVPRAELSVADHHVQLAGLPPAQTASWQQQLRQALGPDFTVDLADPAAAQARATDAFLHAMDALLHSPTPCAQPAVVRVINLQPVDFAPSSGHVPSTASENLSQTARLLAACAARGQPLRLSVDTWTDRHGDPAANLALSQKRADAVRAFLTAAGVPAATLTARGHGATDPVAGNLTAAGRLANRRLRFSLLTP